MRYTIKEAPIGGKYSWMVMDGTDIVSYLPTKEQAEAVAKTLNDMEPLAPGYYWVRAACYPNNWRPGLLMGDGSWTVDGAHLTPENVYEVGPHLEPPK